MVKVYVGCALTHAPESFKLAVEELKKKLGEVPGVQVLQFLGLVDGTSRDVYIHDIIECVGMCDIMFAICDYASIGLGWEMATQVGRGKRLLAFGHREAKITRLILDPPITRYSFHRYDDFEEIYGIAVAAIGNEAHSVTKIERPVSL